jgi:PhzF family phenazine biosynthesis protein
MINAFVVDAFTNQAYQGNPAAVCLLENPLSEKIMQQIASEFNLSETAFLLPNNEHDWNLRWFTPTTEVNLCGHATLASAHVLINEYQLPTTPIKFQTRSGELTAKSLNQKIELDFPLIPTQPIENRTFVNPIANDAISLHQAGEDLLLEFDNELAVRNFHPDLSAIRQLDCRGLIITAPSNGYDCHFVSRFFAPRFGIDEDPVTGSAHCALIDFWHKKTGRDHFIAKQISKRGGTLDIQLNGTRVALRGDSVTTAKVSLLVR